MKQEACCFTGHRIVPPEQVNIITGRLKTEITKLINQGYRYFYAGGAIGFDTIAAQTVIDIKKDHPSINLLLVLPCITQSKGWNESDKLMYEKIKQNADNIIYTSKEYSRGCMHKRNRFLVDNSSMCICYLRSCKGGTYYTVRYAESRNIQIINIS